MIENLTQIKINNKTYLPIDDLIGDLEKHLNRELKYIEEKDKHGYDWAMHETIVYLSRYL